MARYHAFFVLVTACGSSNKASPDAAVDAHLIDARPIDGAPDAAMATGPHHHFVISKETFPTSSNQARALGLDLNNDGAVDNQLGMVLATLAGQGLVTQPLADKAVDAGTILMLADVESADLTTETLAGFTLFSGANPVPAPCAGAGDTVCRHHLAGTGTFDVATGSARDTPITGAIVAGVFTPGPGTLTVQLPILGPMPVTVSLIGARAKLTGVTATGFTGAIIAGGVTQSDLDTKVFPVLQANANAAIQRDCTVISQAGAMQNPACGCAANSTGATMVSLFDTAPPKDCVVSLTEITTNNIVMDLFATDLTINGVHALSLGSGVDAVAGTFTP